MFVARAVKTRRAYKFLPQYSRLRILNATVCHQVRCEYWEQVNTADGINFPLQDLKPTGNHHEIGVINEHVKPAIPRQF